MSYITDGFTMHITDTVAKSESAVLFLPSPAMPVEAINAIIAALNAEAVKAHK